MYTTVKIGDLVKVQACLGNAHPVGIIIKVVKRPSGHSTDLWCLYLDGDYEILEPDTAFEVISEAR